jgi:hypothetical protein
MHSQPHMFKQDCDGTLNIRSEWNKKYPYNKYIDFRNNFFSKNDMKYFSAKKDLVKIHPNIKLENKIVFSTKEIEITLLLKDTIVQDSYNMDYFYDLPPISYYGDIFAGKNKIIDSIFINFGLKNKIKINVPKSLVNDLLKINVNEMFRSYRPIELYYDKTKQWYCIYITGKVNEIDDEYNYSFEPSYIAKIIFIPKSQEIYRLVLPSAYALSYGWLYCDNFWPF